MILSDGLSHIRFRLENLLWRLCVLLGRWLRDFLLLYNTSSLQHLTSCLTLHLAHLLLLYWSCSCKLMLVLLNSSLLLLLRRFLHQLLLAYWPLLSPSWSCWLPIHVSSTALLPWLACFP